MICRQAAEAITQSLDEPLEFRTRVGLGIHTLFCSPCRRFRRQMLQLHAAFQASANAGNHASGGLSDDARERIASALNRADEPH